MRRAGWLLALLGVVAALEMLASALAGNFSTSAQLDFLAKLAFGGFVAFVVIKDGAICLAEMQSVKDWSRWAGLVPLLTLPLILVGLWLWWAYFARHHASIIWLVIVGSIAAALHLFRRKAERHWQELRRDTLTKLPELPNTSGASNPEDFKGWS
jgi:hypothetical protein